MLLILAGCDTSRAPTGAPSVVHPTAAARGGTDDRTDPPSAPAAPSAASASSAAPSGAALDAPVVLAELFTSEGCSSCPPADAVLAELDRDLAPHGLITLSFHVDYWDELGWPDPFSSPLFSARQRAYANHFGARGVYTPQLIISGRETIVGSHAADARATIRDHLTHASPTIPIQLEAERESPTTLRIHWSTPHTPPGTRLHLAAVSPSATTRVPRGENAGRTLHHVQVVRALETTTAPEGTRVLTVANPAATDLLAVAWLQSADLTIQGATRATPQ